MSGATPRGQPWTPALALPHRRDGLSARRMAVLYTFREPSLGRQMHRELMRNALLDLTTIMPATTCHRRSYVETYSRYRGTRTKITRESLPRVSCGVAARLDRLCRQP